MSQMREWWLRQDPEMINQLPNIEREAVVLRHGLYGNPVHSPRQLEARFGVTDAMIALRIKHAKVRVDRSSLLLTGPAMQLRTDYQISELGRLNLTEMAGGKLANTLVRQQLDTINAVLDKSIKWMNGVGMSPQTVATILNLLVGQRLYPRSLVPSDRRSRTALPHTVR